MKTPQRNFVVEFRSGRRQPKAGATSIWGDTDFKALVREAEDRAPHLFNSNEALGTPDEGGALPPSPMNSGSAIDHAGDADGVRAVIPSVDGAAVEGPEQHGADFPAAEPSAQVQEVQSVSLPRRTPSGTPRKLAVRTVTRAITPIVMVMNEDQTGQALVAWGPVSPDDVAALDAENKRLKRLLVEQLRAQNLQLRKMLERFDIT
jgi:hypothetical protein